MTKQEEDCFHLGAKALIFNTENKLLLLEKIPPSKKTYWDIPGGRMQRGETLQQTLLREVFEETSFDNLTNIEPFLTLPTNIRIQTPSLNVGLILSIFRCNIPTPQDPILSQEHSAFGWFSLSEALPRLSLYYPPELLTKLADS